VASTFDMEQSYTPAMWYSKVLRGGQDRHYSFVTEVLAFITAGRRSMRGITHEVLREEETAASWLLEALCQAQAHIPAVPLALPLRPAMYVSTARYAVPFGYRVIARLLQSLEHLGWVTITRGAVDTGFSRIHPAGAFLDHCRNLAHSWVFRPPRDPRTVLLMGKEKRLIQDGEHPMLPEWREELNAVNGFLARQCIHLRASDAELILFAEAMAARNAKKARKRPIKKLVQYGQVSVYRTFSGAFDLGGRLYGGWWQNVPSELRRYIWINEYQAIEVDFSGMALRCLYASEGLPVPDDPYEIGLGYRPEDPRRDIVKEYINAILNDKNHKYWADPKDIKMLGITRAELDRRVRSMHAPIAHHFHTDAGLRMQFVDSKIALLVITRLMRRGIQVLPIHDSFLVQAPFVEDLQREMNIAFGEVTGADAKLKMTPPALIEHFEDSVITRDELADQAALFAHLQAEWDRCSIANEYFFSWAQQMWAEADVEIALSMQEACAPPMLRHHAFPMGLLHVEGEKEEGSAGRGRAALITEAHFLSLLSTSGSGYAPIGCAD
jgi:hypothetical protein